MSRLGVLLFIGIITCDAGAACAHAFMLRAEPPVGAELHAPPPAVTISFTEAVEPSFSTIELDGPGGRVATGTPHAKGDDGRQLTVELPKLAPGAYAVVWHVTSVDTHKTEGSFKFTVAP